MPTEKGNTMFLKKKEVSFGDEQIVLHELSALQRAEYFELLVLHEKETKNLEELELSAKLNRQAVEQLAWIVSRSLWRSDKTRNVDDIYQEILDNWGKSALNEAFNIVSEISGMAGDESDNGELSEPESLEK